MTKSAISSPLSQVSGSDRKDDLPPKTDRRKRQRAEIRERLIRAGIEIMRTQSFQATTVSQITAKADVGQGTFYNYFRSKEHLLAAVTEWPEDQFLECMRRIQENKTTVREVFQDRLGRVQWTPVSYLTCLSVLMANDDVRPFYLNVVHSNREKYERLIILGQERGEIRSDFPSRELAAILQYANYGAAVLESFEASGLPGKPTHGVGTAHFVQTYWSHMSKLLWIKD